MTDQISLQNLHNRISDMLCSNGYDYTDGVVINLGKCHFIDDCLENIKNKFGDLSIVADEYGLNSSHIDSIIYDEVRRSADSIFS